MMRYHSTNTRRTRMERLTSEVSEDVTTTVTPLCRRGALSNKWKHKSNILTGKNSPKYSPKRSKDRCPQKDS